MTDHILTIVDDDQVRHTCGVVFKPTDGHTCPLPLLALTDEEDAALRTVQRMLIREDARYDGYSANDPSMWKRVRGTTNQARALVAALITFAGDTYADIPGPTAKETPNE